MNGASELHLDTALARGLRQALEALQERLGLDEPLAVYLAGGMAVHLYTGERVTTDIDAEFGARVAVPEDLLVEIELEDGTRQVLYFDTGYNPMMAMLHEDYQADALALDLGLEHVRLFVLSPVDLAVSKLARFADVDREDIAALVRSGRVAADDLERRGTQALTGFVGHAAMPRMNLAEAVETARTLERGRARVR